MRCGKMTSVYLQNDIITLIDKAIEKTAKEGIDYHSRNHFINSCVMRELRRLKIV